MQKHFTAVLLIVSLLLPLIAAAPSVHALRCKTYTLTSTEINNAYNNTANQYPKKIALDEELAEQPEWTLTIDYDVLQFTENQSTCYFAFMIDNETDTTGAETDNAEMRMIIYSDEIHFYVTNETNYQQWMPAWTSWTMPITIKAYNENGHYYLNVTDSGSNEFKTDPIMTLYPAYLHYKIKNTTVSSETEITFEFCYGATTSEIINAWIPVIVTFAMLGTALSFIKKVT